MNSPLNLNQQIAITIKEKKKLSKNLKNENFKYRNPEIIIINLDKKFLRNYSIDMNIYIKI